MLIFMLLPTYRMNSIKQGIDGSFSSLSTGSRGLLLSIPHKPPTQSRPNSKAFTFPPSQPDTVPVVQISTPQQQAFAVGVVQGIGSIPSPSLADTDLLVVLPHTVTLQPSTISKEDWKRRKNALIQAGRWSVALNYACNNSSGTSSAWRKKQESLLQSLTKEISAYPESDQFTLFFDSWLRAPESAKDICGRSRALLSMGLGL